MSTDKVLTQDPQVPAPISQKPKIQMRYMAILQLHLSGKKSQEIADIMGCSPLTVYETLKRPEVQYYKQLIMHGYQEEFDTHLEQAYEVVSKTLESKDEKMAMDAAKTFFQVTGRAAPKDSGKVQVTAEDVVIQILNQAKSQ